jgi:hypothetical protein
MKVISIYLYKLKIFRIKKLISAHRLRIETGRYEHIRNSQGNFIMLDRGERICLHCTLNEVEEESHMLFTFNFL